MRLALVTQTGTIKIATAGTQDCRCQFIPPLVYQFYIANKIY